jgi:hypothetical protein
MNEYMPVDFKYLKLHYYYCYHHHYDYYQQYYYYYILLPLPPPPPPPIIYSFIYIDKLRQQKCFPMTEFEMDTNKF